MVTEEFEHFVPEHTFQDFHIDEALKQRIIAKGYTAPTPIQDKAITHVLNGADIVGIANTGTGKTGAFLIPLIHKVLEDRKKQILIIVPTRELAIQIDQELMEFSRGMKIFSVCCVGGAPIGRQLSQLRYQNNFIIGTPGRLKDLIDRGSIRLSAFSVLVLDEADRMLDMGFIHDMRFVMSKMPKERQTLFFSATLSSEIEKLISEFVRTPIRISVKTGDTVGSGGGSSTPPPSEGNSDPPSGAHVFANLQKDSHWNAYALLRAENYHLCDHCSPSGSKINWSTKQGVSSPSVSGSAMKFSVGGDQAYNDMFWNNKFTSRLPDSDHLEKYHEFTYDVYFFGTSLEKSQALEFDINQFYNNRRFIWGHECRIAGGHEWDSWDNNQEHWVKTGIPCNPKSNAWNHLIIKARRIDDTTMEFVSITLNGKTWNENRKDTVLKRDGWHGITINYQMDLNKHADDYTVYLDKLNFYYK